MMVVEYRNQYTIFPCAIRCSQQIAWGSVVTGSEGVTLLAMFLSLLEKIVFEMIYNLHLVTH